MLTLSLPKPSNFVYPTTRFGRLNDVRRHADFNRKAFRDYVSMNALDLENQHMLVGLLQQLSIDPAWDLRYVVEYTRFRSNSLCTLFKITSISHVGEATYAGFYREGVREHWVLLEKDYDYSKPFDLEYSQPIVPLYSTVTAHSYKHNVQRKTFKQVPPEDIAIIGVNLVELAVGWWHYMQAPENDGTGISRYLCQGPLINAQLIQNQLAIQNVMYEHLVKHGELKELIHTDNVTFITSAEKPLLVDYCTFLADRLTANRMVDLGQVVDRFDSLYTRPFFNYHLAGRNALFAQTSWAFEPQVLQLYAIYLAVANAGGYRASDITSRIDRAYQGIQQNYRRLQDDYFQAQLSALATQVFELSKENLGIKA
jgi:hypothetical protein